MAGNFQSTVVFSSDHGGVGLRKQLVAHAKSIGCVVHDVGPSSPDSIDYPDQVQKALAEFYKLNADFIVLICGSGIGVSMAANRDRRIRAVVAANSVQAQLARQHNHANCLCLGARLTNFGEAKEIFNCFMQTEPDMSERHCRRVAQLGAL